MISLAASALVACGDADSTALGGAGAGPGGTGSMGGDVAGSNDSAIVLIERVFSPEGRLYYASVVSEMPTGPLDRSQAREFTSADVELFDGKLFVRDRESNTMTRFSVSSERQLVQEAQLSFQPLGLDSIRFYSAYLSPTRAFLISDEDDMRMIEWNPSTMQLAGNEISLDFVSKPGVSASIAEPIRVGNELVANVAWQDYDNLVMYPGIGALVIDPDAPEAAQLIEDPRVGGGYISYSGANGDAYLVGIVGGDYNLFGTTTNGEPMPASGVVRIAKDEANFDPAYLADARAITGSPAIWAIHRIDDRTLLVQMWDPETSTADLASADDLNDGQEYIYALVDIEAATWTRLDAIARGGAGNSIDHILDGRLYVQSYTDEDAIIYSVSATGIEEAFRVPGGDLWYLKRLR
ncbi:MAG TPA: hypothetical protein VMG12_25915 [Polyangiaceae bacterium]|nr:hypothetical protein [Polyangiaceae bacterium]